MSLLLPQVDRCYFCEIIEGNADRWNVINQTELTITLLNERQFEAGQCLVLPIRHAPTLLDISDQEINAVMAGARQLMELMVNVFTPDGVLIYQNNGIGSGQEVPHFHLHVVPRRAGSDWGLGPPHIARLNQQPFAGQGQQNKITDEMRRTVNDIKMAWGA